MGYMRDLLGRRIDTFKVQDHDELEDDVSAKLGTGGSLDDALSGAFAQKTAAGGGAAVYAVTDANGTYLTLADGTDL